MNILITGAGHLAKATSDLLAKTFFCTVLSRSLGLFEHSYTSTSPSQCIIANLNDERDIEQILCEKKISIVIHLAREKYCIDNQSNPSANNLLMTKRLLNAMQAAGVYHLIFASSAAVYGTSQKGLLTEQSPLNPSTQNGRDKLAIEQYLSAYAKAHPDFSILALRFFNLVPTNTLTHNALQIQASSNLISQVAYALVHHQKLNLAGDFQRDYLACFDAAKAIQQACAYVQRMKGMLCVNIGTGRSTHASQIVAIFEQILGKSFAYEWDQHTSQVNSAIADISLARQLLGFMPSITLEQMCQQEWIRFANV